MSRSGARTRISTKPIGLWFGNGLAKFGNPANLEYVVIAGGGGGGAPDGASGLLADAHGSEDSGMERPASHHARQGRGRSRADHAALSRGWQSRSSLRGLCVRHQRELRFRTNGRVAAGSRRSCAVDRAQCTL